MKQLNVRHKFSSLFPRRSSVATVVVLGIVTVATILMAGFGTMTYVASRNQRLAQLEHDLNLNAEQLAPALALPVWNLDGPQVEKIMESMMLDHSIYALEVRISDTHKPPYIRTRDSYWNVVAAQEDPQESGLVKAERPIRFSGQVIGTVTILETPRFVQEKLTLELFYIILDILLFDATLIISLYALLWYAVLQPLKSVERYAQAMSSAASPGGSAAVRGPKRQFQGELESLRSSIERTMVTLGERNRIERELQHSQRLDSLGRLAGGIAHDMNNVLSAIMSMASAMETQCPPRDPLRKGLDTMLRASQRGRDLVKGLTNFVRKDLETAQVLDLNDLVQRELDLLQRTTLQRVTFVLDLARDLPRIKGEPSAISSVLMNLCVNAIDAMPAGGSITFRTRRLPDGGAELAVIDNGHGMAPEVLAKAMDPFFTTKPPGKGTGLGLASVYGTMKSHGGLIEIESELGRGTSVLLRFPAACEGKLECAQGETADSPHFATKGLTILMVEDDEIVHEAFAFVMETLGHRLEISSGGLEALRRLKSGLTPDLIIMDQNMPGLSGIETLAMLRTTHPTLPVLMCSGYIGATEEALLMEDPAVKILAKPYTMPEIEKRLQEFFPEAGVSQAA